MTALDVVSSHRLNKHDLCSCIYVIDWHFSFFFRGPEKRKRIYFQFSRQPVTGVRTGSRLPGLLPLANMCHTCWLNSALQLVRPDAVLVDGPSSFPRGD